MAKLLEISDEKNFLILYSVRIQNSHTLHSVRIQNSHTLCSEIFPVLKYGKTRANIWAQLFKASLA